MAVLVTKKYILQKNGYKEVFGRWIKITPTTVSIISNKSLNNISMKQLKERILKS